MRRAPRNGTITALGLGAAALEGLAFAALAGGTAGHLLGLAFALHTLAVTATVTAVGMRPGTTPPDRDLVLLLAAIVPPFGVLLGWSMLPGPGGRSVDAHEIFEAQRHVRDARIRAQDRAIRHAAAEPAWSFDEILAHGSIDHRRNALRHLADLGGPRHLELLRRSLGHPDPELRLAAYAEVDRVRRGFQARLDALHAQLEDPRAEPRQLRRALADQHRALARSGLLDNAMARFHLDRAIEHADGAWEAGLDDLWQTVSKASVGLGRGDDDAALTALEQLAEVHDVDAAKIACESLWHLRRFTEARVRARALVEQGTDVPEWIEALAAQADDPAADAVRLCAARLEGRHA